MATKSYHNLGDRTPFWGLKTCQEFKHLQSVLNNKVPNLAISRNCYRELMKIVLAHLTEPKNENDEFVRQFKNLSNEFKITIYNLIAIFSCLLKLFQTSMRISSTKPEVIIEDLIQFLKREVIENLIYDSRAQNLSLKSFNWRIDVGISTSSVTRLLVPTIIAEIKLSDGRIANFEMSLNQFHQLRFNVALVLKEMDEILNRHIFKLAD